MPETSGGVPPPIRPKPTDFSRQRSDQPITCTANALVNALRLRGAIVSQGQEQSLVQRTLDSKAPLNRTIDMAPIAASHGYSLETWRLPASEITSPESIAQQFAARLDNAGPGLMSISSALSKRDRSVAATVGFDPQLLQNNVVVHRVAVEKEGDVVRIIDSYNPQSPEEFNMQDPQEQKRLTAWIISADIDTNTRLAEPTTTLNNEQLLAKATDWLDNKFDPFRAMAKVMNANVENLVPITTPPANSV